MKKNVFLILVLITANSVFAQNNYSLPGQWDKSFVISNSHTGSMSGGTSRLTFTYDSCTYITSSSRNSPTKKRFALSQADRDKILKKMRDLKVDKIREGLTFTVQNDGWSTLLCFGGHCVEGGSASEMTDKDKDVFLTACRYLEEFAISR